MHRKFLLAGLFFAVSVRADYFPTSWRYLDPNAPSLAGIDWRIVRNSDFAEAASAALRAGGAYPLPELDLFARATSFYISTAGDPEKALVIVAGEFNLPALRQKAAKLGLKPDRFRGLELYLGPGKPLSFAIANERLLLFGARPALTAALERGMSDKETQMNPIYARAAQLASAYEFWVVSTRFDESLTGDLLPLEKVREDVAGIEAGFRFRNGLAATVTLDVFGVDSASTVAETLRTKLDNFAKAGGTVSITPQDEKVRIGLAIDDEHLAAMAGPAPAPAETAQPAAIVVQKGGRNETITLSPGAAGTAAKGQAAAAPKPEPAQPKVIRIYGLDEGVKEIKVPDPPRE